MTAKKRGRNPNKPRERAQRAAEEEAFAEARAAVKQESWARWFSPTA